MLRLIACLLIAGCAVPEMTPEERAQSTAASSALLGYSAAITAPAPMPVSCTGAPLGRYYSISCY